MVAREEGTQLASHPIFLCHFASDGCLQEANCRRKRSLFEVPRSGGDIYSSGSSSSFGVQHQLEKSFLVLQGVLVS